MRKAMLMGSMVLLVLAAFAPSAMAQEVVDAEAIIEDIQVEHGFFGSDFFGGDFFGGGFFGGDFFDEGEGNEEGPAGGSESDCIEDPNNPGQPAPDCEDVG